MTDSRPGAKIRQIKLFRRLQAEIENAGFEPRQIPDSIWIPAFTEALQQDDDALHEKWAKLLAKAADPHEEMIPQSFPRILAELSATEVRFLDRLYEHLSESGSKYSPHEKMGFTVPLHHGGLADIYMTEQLQIDDFLMVIDNLLRLRLLEAEPAPLDRDQFLAGEPISEEAIYRMSSLGYAFMSACKPSRS